MSDHLTSSKSAPPRRPHFEPPSRIRVGVVAHPSPRPRVHGRRRLGGPWRAGSGIPTLFAVLLLVGPLLALPVASASPTVSSTAPPPFNAPNLISAVIIDSGAALGLVGYTGWFGSWTPASNGTQIYSNQFYLIFFNLRSVGFQLVISITQNGGVVGNSTTYIPPISEDAQLVSVPSNPEWVDTNLTFSGTPAWHGQMATPVSFLPNSVANLGGLDLLAFVLISFMVLISSLAFGLAKWAMRRMIWAPEFRLYIWAHVLLAAVAAVVFLDFQQIDATFAGWTPLVYPWATFPLFFLSGLFRFNRAPYVQVQQGIATPSGEMGTRVWRMRAGPLPDGRVAWVGESWGQAWARFWGHFPILWDGNPETTPPFLSPVENMISPTASPRERMRMEKARQKYPLTAHPLFRFAVQNPQDDGLAYIAWTKTSEPVAIDWPYLSFHRTVDVPAKYEPAPNGGVVMVAAATTKKVLTWPHYVDPVGQSHIELEDKHFVFGASVWAGFATLKDLSRVISKLGSELSVLKAHLQNLVQDELYSKLRIHYSLTGRATSGISDEEAAALSGQMERLVTPTDGEGRKA